MSHDFLLMFNHTLTDQQYYAARQNFGITRVREMPEDLKRLWGQIPADAEELSQVLKPFKKWLKQFGINQNPVLIQGDFGATYAMVHYAVKLGLIPVYATTIRKALEIRESDGRIRMEHIFEFCRFRRYQEL